MDKATRIQLNQKLIQACSDLRSLNRVRGPLGHGIVYFADKAERQARLRAEIDQLRIQLGK